MQRFAAREKFEFANGAIGWQPGGPMDCLGPWAKVNNCPIEGTDLRLTCARLDLSSEKFEAKRIKTMRDAIRSRRTKFTKIRQFAKSHRAEFTLLRTFGRVVDDRPGEGRVARYAFLASLRHQIIDRGELSPAQVAALTKALTWVPEAEATRAAAAERRAADAATAKPCPEGRVEVVGEVVTTKWHYSDFGDVLKMLVRSDDDYKVWGTIPRALVQAAAESEHADANDYDDAAIKLRGCRVRFTATLQRSRDDECFGFFKRPSKAALLTEEVTA